MAQLCGIHGAEELRLVILRGVVVVDQATEDVPLLGYLVKGLAKLDLHPAVRARSQRAFKMAQPGLPVLNRHLRTILSIYIANLIILVIWKRTLSTVT